MLGQSTIVLQAGEVRELAKRAIGYYHANDMMAFDSALEKSLAKKNTRIRAHNSKMKKCAEFFNKWFPNSEFWVSLKK